ncbi:MAG: hypothetical protein E7247_21735 [Paenibacillaceae bacterium]|nr:hypothetical protein [Paenibacillaceae bacterium]
MNISKNKGLSLVITFIIFAVYNIIAFLLPNGKGGMFWTGYGFSMAAILLTAGVGFYTLERKGLKSKVYGVSLLTLVWSYLIAQLIIGLLEMALPSIPFQYGIILNAILLGGCLIGLIAADIAIDEVERIDENVKKKVSYIKSLQTDIESLIGKNKDEAAKKALKDLAEAIRYSDPMSSSQLSAIENEIKVKAAGLTDAAASADSSAIVSICGEMQQLVAERNRTCKTLK